METSKRIRGTALMVAHAVGCDDGYARQVLRGERPANSELAKRIVAKAKELDQMINNSNNVVTD